MVCDSLHSIPVILLSGSSLSAVLYGSEVWENVEKELLSIMFWGLFRYISKRTPPMLILHIVCIPGSVKVALKFFRREIPSVCVWMQGHCSMNKTVGYEKPIKCYSLSVGTHEHDGEYTWIELYLHGASCEGSAESFRRKTWQRIVSCKSLCQRFDFRQVLLPVYAYYVL